MYKYLIFIFFFCLIVLGESFKINLGFASVNILLIIAILIFICFPFTPMRLPIESVGIKLYVFVGCILLFAIIGINRGNKSDDIIEDIIPFLFLFLFYIFIYNLSLKDINKLWYLLIFFSIIAAAKVILINLFNIDVQWDNNWQAKKDPLPIPGAFRIILKGADIFFSICLGSLLLCLNKLKEQYKSLIYFVLILLVYAVFISLSRSSYLGIGGGVVIALLVFNKKSINLKKMFLSIFIVFSLFLITIPFFNFVDFSLNIFQARVSEYDKGGVATSFREDENEIILNKSTEYAYLGNGLGASFQLPYSGSDKLDGRSLYAHNFNFWLLLKCGIVGLITFFILYLALIKGLWQRFVASGNERHKLVMLSAFSGLIILFVVSIFANKLSTISGCVFLAYVVALHSKLKANENRH